MAARRPIAVTGARGRLGRQLLAALSATNRAVVEWSRPDYELDDESAAARLVARDEPELVVHAAAWTDVDGCARDPALAMRRNATAVGELARACAPAGSRLLLVSTNEVYVGGLFTNAAGVVQADFVARWNGRAWSALGSSTAGNNGALNNYVAALTVSSSGDLYVGGDFIDAAGINQADRLARWNGTSWSALGSNEAGTDGALNNYVAALTVSSSGDLYVGGAFSNAAGIAQADRVARWDGTSWSALGSNPAGTDGALIGNSLRPVRALAVSGSNLYVGGDFTDAAGNIYVDYVARWDGNTWSALGADGAGTGGALNTSVRALAVSGSNLYVGGSFTNAAGIAAADYVARWDGSAWSALGSNHFGDGALNGGVFALAVLGSDVYVGGSFTNAADIATADYVARWSGSSWSALGSNHFGDGALDNTVFALAIMGTDLFVGGVFQNAALWSHADYVAHWNGSFWSALGSNAAGTDGALNGGVSELAIMGTDLYVGGSFTNAADIGTADRVARWDGEVWSALGSNAAGTDGALNSTVFALAVSGSDVYVGGFFTDATGIAQADYVARWNGSAWSALGSDAAGTNGALTNTVRGLALSGSGDLYVGGAFTNAADISTADRVARWNGSKWSALGSNAAGTDGALNGGVFRLAIMGSGLYVGGDFLNAAGIAEADYVARYAPILSACTTPPFTDVPTNHPFCPEIKWMKEAGISTGFPDGTYRPSIAVTRQAMSAFMARLAGATSLPACASAPFSDVPIDHPFCKEIRWMKESGVSTGFPDGTYRPSTDVTRQAMSAFMYRVSGLLP